MLGLKALVLAVANVRELTVHSRTSIMMQTCVHMETLFQPCFFCFLSFYFQKKRMQFMVLVIKKLSRSSMPFLLKTVWLIPSNKCKISYKSVQILKIYNLRYNNWQSEPPRESNEGCYYIYIHVYIYFFVCFVRSSSSIRWDTVISLMLCISLVIIHM